ncbi:MAG: hypothetical protein IK999_14795 [Ruminococcus sp.]|nr:hypothetical protein [Ruminococcus sp.]
MKKTFKYISALLAAIMVISVSMSVFAIELPFVPVDDTQEQEQTTPAPTTPTNPTPTPVITVDPAPVIQTDPAPTVQDTSVPGTTPTVAVDNTVTGTSTASPSYSGSYGGYTVTYTADPAYAYTSATVKDTARKKELKISARTDEKGNIVLEWEKIRKADKYTVYRLSGKRYTKVGDTKDTSYTFRSAENGKNYKFMVRYSIDGEVSGVNDSFKIAVSVKKSAAKPIVTASAKDGKVTLKWNAVEGASQYAVYRVTNGNLKKVTTTAETYAVIKQKPTDKGYAVKAYVNGKWKTVSKSDIVTRKAE